MKKNLIIVCMIFLFSFALFASSAKETSSAVNASTVEQNTNREKTPVISTELATLSNPICRVELYDSVTISQQDLDEAVSFYSSNLGYSVPESSVLEELINNILLTQELEKALEDGTLDIYNGEFNDFANVQLQTLAAQYGYSLKSENDARRFLELLETSYEDFVQTCLTQWAHDKYIDNFSNGKLTSIPNPTEDEINNFYQKNLSSFVGDNFVKVAHIFFSTAENKNAALQKANDVYSQISSGLITFEKACSQYSEDERSSSSGGTLEYWVAQEDKDMLKAFGEEAMKAMLALDAGDISRVVEGPQGYHIFKCLATRPASLLGLNDIADPNYPYTVGSLIAQSLKAENYQKMYLEVSEEIIKDLRSKASIQFLK